jgi:hypothetical protein
MTVLCFYYVLSTPDKIGVDLLLPPFTVFIIWVNGQINSQIWGPRTWKPTNKQLAYLLGVLYLAMIVITIYVR